MAGKNAAAQKVVQKPQPKEELECGAVGTYGDLGKKSASNKKGKVVWNSDHVPAKAQLFQRAKKLGLLRPGKSAAAKALYTCVRNGVKNGGMAIAIPVKAHYKGATYGGKNNAAQVKKDANGPTSLKAAVKRDMDAISPHLDAACKAKYEAARQQMMDFDVDGMIKKVYKDCGGK